jgi:hypothetical protein
MHRDTDGMGEKIVEEAGLHLLAILMSRKRTQRAQKRNWKAAFFSSPVCVLWVLLWPMNPSSRRRASRVWQNVEKYPQERRTNM